MIYKKKNYCIVNDIKNKYIKLHWNFQNDLFYNKRISKLHFLENSTNF